MNPLDIAEFTLVTASTFFTTSFVVIYLTQSKWRSSVVGRAMLFQAFSWLALLAIGVAAVLNGDTILWTPISRILVLALLTSSSGFLLYALVSSLKKDQKARDSSS